MDQKKGYKQTEIGEIPEEWEVMKLLELCVKITDGSHFSPKTVSNGPLIATVKDMTAHGFNYESCRKISEEDFEKLTRQDCKPQVGDILIAKDGSYLKHVFVVTKDEKIVLLSSIAIIRPNLDKVDPHFIKFLFLDPVTKERVKGNYVSGAVIPRIILKDFAKIDLPVPSLPEQHSIAKILSDLDSKIELLQQQNKTLESIGKTIFKQWFVDFEFPNESGKPYKSSGGKMKESELGDIPEGWGVGKIEDVAQVIGGGTPSTAKNEYFTSDGIPWLSPKDLTGFKGKFISRGATDITEEGLKNSSAKIMPRGTVVFSSRAPIGYCAIAENQITTNQGFKSLVPQNLMSSEFLYQFLIRNLLIIESRAHGSTFKEVNGATMKNIEMIIPSNSILEQHKKLTNPINERFCNNQHQIMTLIEIRDSLLPKLMSGKIRVPVEVIE